MLAFLKFKKVSQLHTIAHAVRRSHFKPLPDIRKILDQPAQVRTMYGVHCTMYNVRRTLYAVHCTKYNVRRTLYNVHSPYNPKFKFYIIIIKIQYNRYICLLIGLKAVES